MSTAAEDPSLAGRLAQLRRRWLAPFLVCLAAFKLIFALLGLAAAIPLPTDLTFPEGAIAARALDVARDINPYHDWRVWPHHFAPYGPLTYYAPGTILRLADATPSIADAYTAGRIWSFVCILIILIAITLYLRHRRLAWPWLLIAGGALFIQIGQWEYALSFRPDAPKACLAVAAVLIAASGPATRLRLLGAFTCLYLAYWFKPTAWAPTLVLFLWVARSHGWRRMLLAAACFALAGLLPAWLIDRAWDGRLFLNMIRSLENGIAWRGLIDYAFSISSLDGIILLMATCGATCWLITEWRRGFPDANWVLPAALVGTFVVTLGQLLKQGADQNYWIDAWILSVVVMVIGLEKLWRGHPAVRPPLRETILLLLVSPLAMHHCYLDFKGFVRQFPLILRQRDTFPIIRAARTFPEPLLASNPFIVLQAGEEPSILDQIQYRILVERGLLDPAPLFDRLRMRQFGAVILVSSGDTREAREADWRGMFSPGFYDLLLAHYRLVDQFGLFYIFMPASTAR